MATLTSGARRTVGILRTLCDMVSLPVAEYLTRMVVGFGRYGADNHLTMPLDEEWLPEILDVTTFPAIGVSQGRVGWDNPHLRRYMELCRDLMQTYRDLLEWERNRRDAA